MWYNEGNNKENKNGKENNKEEQYKKIEQREEGGDGKKQYCADMGGNRGVFDIDCDISGVVGDAEFEVGKWGK